MTNAEDVHQYINGVLDGSIVTGRLERLAVWRHVDDLKHAGERGFYFDEKIADRAIKFSALCNQFEGEWAGKPLVLRPEQKFIVWCVMGWRQKVDGLRRFRQAQLEVGRKWGKALALDTMLPTPTGWTTMGEVQIGDELFDENGNVCQVTNKTVVMFNRPCYRVTFSDRTSIIADAEHEWMTETLSTGISLKGGVRVPTPTGYRVCHKNSDGTEVTRTRIRTTREIASTLLSGGRKVSNHRIAVCGALALPDVDLPIHPYVLGAWLGDGHSAGSRFTCAFADAQILDEIAACGVSVRQCASGATSTTGLYILGSNGRGGSSSLQSVLRTEGLLNNKHIPAKYLRASESQRWDMLRGLMDTDGCSSSKNRKCEFTSTSRRIADGVLELARSLGLKPTLAEGTATIYGKDCGAKYRVTFSPPEGCQIFRLQRKQQRLDDRSAKPCNGHRSIVDCSPCQSAPVQCVEVDSPSHLYLAGEAMIPTHNSTMAAYMCCLLLYCDTPIERGAQVYCAATKQDQAKIVWQAAQKMIERSPVLASRAKSTPSKLLIELPEYDSVFRPIASDSKTVDGFNPHCIIKDEEHAWREMHRGLADTLASGFGARSQPITITITTYGDDESLIWQENHNYAVRCLESVISGDIVDDSWFAYIAALDYPKEQPCFRCRGDECKWCGGTGEIPPDDPYDETVWRKANPGIGEGVGFTPKLERMRDAALMAKQRADKQSEFFQKNLNIIVSARNKAITPEAWTASRGYPQPLNKTGHGGIDLGRSNDFAAIAMVFPFHEIDDDGDLFTRYECITKSWTTRGRPQDLRMPMISMWIEGGYLEECSGDAVDFMDVEQQILAWHRAYSIETWAYDVKFAPQLAQRIEYEGLTPFAFSQSHKFYTAPLVELLKIVGKSRMVNGVSVPMFKHDGNPCLAWQAGNLIIDKNARQELMPVKGQDVNKIDVMVAILMALSECLYHQQQSDGYWLTNKLVMGG